jgi:hypothetical protein
VDIDADGYPDILSGSYSREGKMAGLFQVLRGKPDGSFRKAEVLKGTDGQPLIIPIPEKEEFSVENICTRPFAVDWDGDGHLDLVVGNFGGTFYWFKGEGKGKFRPKPELIKNASGKPLRIDGNHSDPFVIDWNGDGALDIVSGSSEGGVQWAKNQAPRGKPPQFDRFEWLIKPGRSIQFGDLADEKALTGPTTATRVWVTDFNGDGKLDLLVGDRVMLCSPAKGVSVADYKKKFEAWQKAVAAASEKMSSANAREAKASQEKDDKAENPEKAQEEYLKVYQQRNEFMKKDWTGFVWLYLQK